MTAPDQAGGVCPYLGLDDDPATHFAFPSHAQRCHATSRPSMIETGKQARDCLTPQHVGCSRYRPVAAAVPHGAVRAALAAGGQGHPQASAIRSPVRRSVALLILAALFLVAAIGGIVLGRIADLGGDQPAGAAPAQASRATAMTASATATATPSPAPTATPTTAVPTPSPTPRVTSEPTPLVHRIRPGETLTGIAQRYGVTIAALQRVNRIPDPNHILVGQVLVIPRR